MGLSEILLVVFIVLKLIGVIDWSWWWVTAPFWIPFTIAFVVAGLAIVANAKK